MVRLWVSPCRIFIKSIMASAHIGRTAHVRPSSRYGSGMAWRWREHVWGLLSHRVGDFVKSQRRARYFYMLRETNHTCPTLICIRSVAHTHGPAYEAAIISMCQPSANNLKNAFGVKRPRTISKLGGHRSGRTRQRASKWVRAQCNGHTNAPIFRQSRHLFHQQLFPALKHYKGMVTFSGQTARIRTWMGRPFSTCYSEPRRRQCPGQQGPADIYACKATWCLLRHAGLHPACVDWGIALGRRGSRLDVIFLFLSMTVFITNYIARVIVKFGHRFDLAMKPRVMLNNSIYEVAV